MSDLYVSQETDFMEPSDIAKSLATKFSVIDAVRKIDKDDFRGTLLGLAEQCRAAWNLGHTWQMPESMRQPKRVIVAGVGGSAIGADVVATCARLATHVPVEVTRDYTLPPLDEDCLVMACSFSGETEEAIKPFEEAAAAGAMCLAVTTGGALERAALKMGAPLVTYNWNGTPRSAIGYGVFLPLAILSRLGLFEISDQEVQRVITNLEELSEKWAYPVADDIVSLPALIAAEILDRIPLIVGAGFLGVAARRWAGELAENSKLLAVPVTVPEFNHNLLEGAVADALRYQREGATDPWFVILLDAEPVHPRNRLRMDITRMHFEEAGRKAWHIDVGGTTPLESIMRACTLASWTSFYLALYSGIDPTTVDILAQFKRDISNATESS